MDNNKVKKSVTIYADGACSGNPGPGGYGAILIYGNIKKEISGGSKITTNNIMELTGVIEALKLLKQPCDVLLHSDSAYVVNAFNQKWINTWQRNGWKNSSKETVKNLELWKELLELTKYHNVEFIKVKGHSNNLYNNRCDRLATKERDKAK